jgi:hypothetical protein
MSDSSSHPPLSFHDPLASPEAVGREPAPFPVAPDESQVEQFVPDWRRRLTRNLSSRSDGRWEPLTLLEKRDADRALPLPSVLRIENPGPVDRPAREAPVGAPVPVADKLQAAQPAALRSTTSRRLSAQIQRMLDGTFGARTGLRSLVRIATSEMILAGGSPDSIRKALTLCARPYSQLAVEGAAVEDAEKGARRETELLALTKLMHADAEELLASRGEGL